jgi:aspartate carbamoyltransferase catalytic subunit
MSQIIRMFYRIFLHDSILRRTPRPVNCNLEMESEVADGSNSAILQQVTNGLTIRLGRAPYTFL